MTYLSGLSLSGHVGCGIHKYMPYEQVLYWVKISLLNSEMGQFIHMGDISVYLFYPFLALFSQNSLAHWHLERFCTTHHHFCPTRGRRSTCHDYIRFKYKTLLGENLLRASSHTFLILQQFLPIYSCWLCSWWEIQCDAKQQCLHPFMSLLFGFKREANK